VLKRDIQRVVTKHNKVYEQLLQSVRAGFYDPGERMPNEKQFAAQFQVSVGTITRVLETLVREGVLTRRRGSGTYISTAPAAEAEEPHIIFVLRSATDIDSHAYLQPIFHALSESTTRQGVSFEVAVVAPAHWQELPRRFPGSGFYFVSPVLESLPMLVRLWDRHPCFVVVGASWDEPVPFPTVDCDNRRGAHCAVEYLLHLGHRRIAMINGEESSTNCRDRRRGYEEALGLWDIPADPSRLVQADGSMELSSVARNRVMNLLLARQGPTAIFCAGYYLALEVIDIARQLDVALPAHLSVIAVDNPKSAQYLQPPLTTLCQPLAEIGARGAARLLSLMRNGTSGIEPSEQLPAELILRGSCAPPREMLSHAAHPEASRPLAAF